MQPHAALRVKNSDQKKRTDWNRPATPEESNLKKIMRLKDLGMSASRFWRKREKREGMCRGRGRKRKRRDTRRKKGGAKSWKERGGGRGGRRGRRGEEEEKAE